MEILGQDRREGLGRKASSRFSLFLLTAVAVLLLFSSLYSAQASVFRKARENAMDAAAPILSFLSGPITYVDGMVGKIGDYFRVLEQNDALRQENAELRQWMDEALALRETIAAYEQLQTYQAPPNARPVDAFVIGETNDAFAHSMLVNAGMQKNIKRGQAVIDDRGLVGRIVETGAHASRVLLLTDIQSRVPVYIEGAEVEGILVGRTKAHPEISFIEKDVQGIDLRGQRVLTSGAGGVLPRGLPVGVISDGEQNEMAVNLYANYARTRMVRVMNYEFPQLAPTEDTTISSTDALDG